MRVQPPEVGVASDEGRVRDHNEDGFLVRPPLFAVADGMGGHAAGEVASRLALQSLGSKGPEIWSGGREALLRALDEANRVVFRQAKSKAGERGMGTTCALILLDGDRVHVGHVGDSRVYRLRAGALEQLTRDHTVVGDMVEQGLLTPQQALADGNRGFLTRALGAAARVDAEVQTVDMQAGDRFLVCSDGLTGMLSDRAIEQILLQTADPQVAADRLIAAANEAGGEDNVTALIVHPPVSDAGVAAVRTSGRSGRVGASRMAGWLLAAALIGGVGAAWAWSQAAVPIPSPPHATPFPAASSESSSPLATHRVPGRSSAPGASSLPSATPRVPGRSSAPSASSSGP